MKKTVFALLTLIFALSAWAQDAAVAPASVDDGAALKTMLRGEFRQGLEMLEASGELLTGSRRARAAELVNAYLAKREHDEALRRAEQAKAVHRAASLLEIARLAENGEGKFADVRKVLENVRDVLVDLLAAPKVEENIQPGDWMVQRLAADRRKIEEHIERVRGMLAGDEGRHAAAVEAGMTELLAGYDTFAAVAGKLDYSTIGAAKDSLDSIEDDSSDLAVAMDDLMALVSEMPWRDALDRLRLVRLIAYDDHGLMDGQLARDIVGGAETQAAAYSAKGEYYKALSLYGLLDDIYAIDNDTRYKNDINRVTRQAVMMSLYAVPERSDYADDESGLQRYEKAMDSYAQDWKDHIRGVDFYMVRMALARINDYYVETPDFSDLLFGALKSLEMLVEIPRIDATFEGLHDEKARKGFLDELASIRDQAKEAGQLDYRMVGRSLNRILWVNRRSINIPDEVIDVEFTNGMLGRLDRFTTMIWPNSWKEFRKQITGNFKGVGIQIQFQRETDYIAVISPLENSPAYRAGIQAGDLITRIDGEDAKGIDTDEAVERITGPAGTKVVLTVKRPGRAEPIDFELTREEINVHTVKGWKRIDDGGWDWMIDPEAHIGYVRITSFTEDTVPGLQNAIAQMRLKGAKGMILDMRGNPGGMFTAAVGVTDEYVKSGTIVSTRGRRPEDSHEATVPGGFEDGALVVLIDQSSASAAEIVSGALKDLGRATIVGRRSFGKGSVQNLVPIRPDPTGDNESHLKITTAYYYLPSGRCLHRLEGARIWGVDPDIDVAMTPRQTRRWLMYRNRTEIIRQWDAARLDQDMAGQLAADLQLEAALLVCKLKVMTGE